MQEIQKRGQRFSRRVVTDEPPARNWRTSLTSWS